MDKEILVKKKHEKLENIFTFMLKYYKHTKLCFSVEYNRVFIKRESKFSGIIAFYHFDFCDLEIRSSYWNARSKKWISYTIIKKFFILNFN